MKRAYLKDLQFGTKWKYWNNLLSPYHTVESKCDDSPDEDHPEGWIWNIDGKTGGRWGEDAALIVFVDDDIFEQQKLPGVVTPSGYTGR